jgi:hypothetical protein
MLVMNEPEFQSIAYQLAQRRFARRVTFQQVQEPFINNLNVNIQINNIHFNEIKGQEEEHIQETIQAIKQAQPARLQMDQSIWGEACETSRYALG